MKDDKVAVIGIAHNGKGGALIVTEENDVYYIDKLDSWDDLYNGKKVIVSGILKIETFKKEYLQNENGGWKQGIIGDKKKILVPNWEIVEK